LSTRVRTVPERVISIKMPGTLVQELRRLTSEHHYLDLSEQVRSIVRQKCLQYSAPNSDLKSIRDAVERQIKSANQQKKEQILQELARLLREGGS
jgi:metal-responsive CopG/Arc/MetJ family transcriptional regulator